MKLWGFTTEKYHVPDKAERDAVIKKIDYKKIELLSDYQVRIPSGMAIDLGAAAKGYLSQKIIDLCKEKKVISCILSLGGNVQTIGMKPDDTEYTVGITDPSDGSSIYGTVKVGFIREISKKTENCIIISWIKEPVCRQIIIWHRLR